MNCDRLNVWKLAVALSIEAYKELEGCRNFGFVDQITRSALSVFSNLAEGLEKSSFKDQVRFIEYSKGSCAEFITQSYVGQGAGFIPQKIADEWIKQAKSILGMLINFEKSIRRKLERRT